MTASKFPNRVNSLVLVVVCRLCFADCQDLDTETLLHIDAENKRQTLEEELEFLKQVHEQVSFDVASYLIDTYIFHIYMHIYNIWSNFYSAVLCIVFIIC